MLKSISILLGFLLCLCALFSACESSATVSSNSSEPTSSFSGSSPSVIQQPQHSMQV